jgi:hypothetical protein
MKEDKQMASERMTTETTNSKNGLREVGHCPDCGHPYIRVPVLKCTRCEELHPLRAFTYRSGRRYIAECIDLDLLAQGDTLEEAIGKLQESMVGYLELAFSGSTNGLVLRPSPLSHKIRYWAHRLKCRFASHASRQKHFVPVAPPFGSMSHC